MFSLGIQSTWVYNTVIPSTTVTSTATVDSRTTAHFNSITNFGPSYPQGTNKTEQGLLELANSLANQVSLSRLPPPEPNIFNVDPLSYPGWKSAFQILIEQRNIPPSERIHYLKKYLSASVKDVIEGFF